MGLPRTGSQATRGEGWAGAGGIGQTQLSFRGHHQGHCTALGHSGHQASLLVGAHQQSRERGVTKSPNSFAMSYKALNDLDLIKSLSPASL